MIYNFNNIYDNFDDHINSENYDLVILGSGPAAAVLAYYLSKKKKVLILERGSFKKKYESIKSKDFKISKQSRTFSIGGTSLDWSNISSYFESFEMRDFLSKKKNIWPLSYKELLFYYKKLNKKFNFNYFKIKKKIKKIPFENRFFLYPDYAFNFRNFFFKKNIDLLYNCKVDYLNEDEKFTKVYLLKKKSKYLIMQAKKVIICCGAIESVLLILKSIKKGFLINLKNKNYIGKFFMDHPKGNVGFLKYPNENLLKKIQLKKNRRFFSYYGISLKQNIKEKKYLNTYIRFEKINSKISKILNYFYSKKNNSYRLRIFFEMIPKKSNYIKLYKNKYPLIKLSTDKIEIKTANLLINKVYNYFSEKPLLEDIRLLKKNNLKLKGASHHMGGLIFPKNVNKNLGLLGSNKIYCCSSAVFPTSGSVNPTMTICALAVRLAQHLIK